MYKKNGRKSAAQVSCVGAMLTVSSNLDSQHPPPQKRAECKTRKFAQSNQSWTQALSGEMRRLGAMKTGTKRYKLALALIFITTCMLPHTPNENEVVRKAKVF